MSILSHQIREKSSKYVVPKFQTKLVEVSMLKNFIDTKLCNSLMIYLHISSQPLSQSAFDQNYQLNCANHQKCHLNYSNH